MTLIKKLNPNHPEKLWVANYNGEWGPMRLFSEEVYWYECDQCTREFYIDKDHIPMYCPMCGL